MKVPGFPGTCRCSSFSCSAMNRFRVSEVPGRSQGSVATELDPSSPKCFMMSSRSTSELSSSTGGKREKVRWQVTYTGYQQSRPLQLCISLQNHNPTSTPLGVGGHANKGLCWEWERNKLTPWQSAIRTLTLPKEILLNIQS